MFFFLNYLTIYDPTAAEIAVIRRRCTASLTRPPPGDCGVSEAPGPEGDPPGQGLLGESAGSSTFAVFVRTIRGLHPSRSQSVEGHGSESPVKRGGDDFDQVYDQRDQEHEDGHQEQQVEPGIGGQAVHQTNSPAWTRRRFGNGV